jgi:hypothetical protein
VNIFILAHILADFVFQRDIEVEEKNNGIVRGNLKHIIKVSIVFVISALCYLLLLEVVDIVVILKVSAFVVINLVLHFFLDLLKSKIQQKRKANNLLLLFIDQILHITVLIVAFIFLLGDYFPRTNFFDNYVLFFIFLIVSTFVSSVIIREILSLFHLEYKDDSTALNGEDVNKGIVIDSQTDADEVENKGLKIGKWIGIIERTIMFLSLYFNIFGLLTIVVAFKTLTRYENIKKNPEYYIIGNLLSILFALVAYGIYTLVI